MNSEPARSSETFIPTKEEEAEIYNLLITCNFLLGRGNYVCGKAVSGIFNIHIHTILITI
jgi:hypothetical protein